MSNEEKGILITGGAGYVGSRLVPKLLDEGYKVNVLDLFIYGEDVFGDHQDHPNLTLFKGDIRDNDLVEKTLENCNKVIHLACISNDPSFELDPELGKSINLDPFRPLVQASKRAGVERFIYASSSSVYGVHENVEVTEDTERRPLTDYSKFKADCEDILAEEREDGFCTTIIRPATVCGYAKRQRLDVIVNILTNFAVNNGQIKVFGGKQKRPNVHIEDMVDAYLHVLTQPKDKVDGKTYNVGSTNYTVEELAFIVRDAIGEHVKIEYTTTVDERSYHVSSQKILDELGFAPKHTVKDAVLDLRKAFEDGLLPDSMDDSKYFNIKRMQELSMG